LFLSGVKFDGQPYPSLKKIMTVLEIKLPFIWRLVFYFTLHKKSLIFYFTLHLIH